METIREKFIKLRLKEEFKTSDFKGIASRQTIERFENGGDITLSKLVLAVRKMGKEVTIWM